MDVCGRSLFANPVNIFLEMQIVPLRTVFTNLATTAHAAIEYIVMVQGANMNIDVYAKSSYHDATMHVLLFKNIIIYQCLKMMV